MHNDSKCDKMKAIEFPLDRQGTLYVDGLVNLSSPDVPIRIIFSGHLLTYFGAACSKGLSTYWGGGIATIP